MVSGRLQVRARLAVRCGGSGQCPGFRVVPARASEALHFDMSSLRVGGKIVAMVPPDRGHLHVLADDSEVSACVVENLAAVRDSLRLVIC